MKKVKLAIFGLFLVATTSCKKAEKTVDEQPKELTVSTFAGSGAMGLLDAPRTNAQFSLPQGVALDPQQNLYVADYFNHRIRKITPEGVVTTFAGSTEGFANGTGTGAQFYYPTGIVCDPNGNLYVADSGNYLVRKITPGGVVSTYAGSTGGFQDGAALDAQFSTLRYLAIDGTGNIYVADNGNNRIRKITPAGQVSTVAGNGDYGFDDGPIATATIGEPIGVTIDPSGNLYISQAGEFGLIRKVSNGQMSRVSGVTLPSDYLDGVAGIARIAEPGNLRSDAEGNIYITDTGNSLIRKYDPKANYISTYAGNFNYIRVGGSRERPSGSFSDGPADQALFNNPMDFIFNAKGEMYVSDYTNNMIRKVGLVDKPQPLSQSEIDKENWNKPGNWK